MPGIYWTAWKKWKCRHAALLSPSTCAAPAVTRCSISVGGLTALLLPCFMQAGWGNRRPPALTLDWEISTQVPPLKFQADNGGRSPFVWKQLKISSRGSKSSRHNNPLFDHLTVTITHIAHKPCVYVPQIAFIPTPPTTPHPLVLFQKASS